MRFVRENRQMTNKKLYCEDVLQMLLADSDSEGEYLWFENDDRPCNCSRFYLGCAMVPPRMARVFTKHKQVIISALYPTGMGVTGGGRGLSVHRRGSALLMIAPDCAFFSDRVRSKCHR